jgi:periplasmic divalent cation tolerance protein
MNEGELWVMTTTFPERAEAERVCALLVDAGLAVCAQVGAEIAAVYRWEGEVRRETEVPVVLKVLKARYELCAGELKLQHPYEVPQLVGWPAGRTDDAYLAWARGGDR